MTNSRSVPSRCLAAGVLALVAVVALAGSAEGRPAPFRGEVSFRAGDGAGSGSVVVSGSLKRWRGGRLVVERRSAGAWKRVGGRAIGRARGRKVSVAVAADAGSVLRVKARRGRLARVLGRVRVKAPRTTPDPDTNDAQPTRPAPPSATRTLTVKSVVSGGGSGTVVSEPAGISCVAGGSECEGRFALSGKVTLSAVADEGSDFVEWGGDCQGRQATCTVSMNSYRKVTAYFQKHLTPGYPDCAGYGEVVPELGYSLCTHWRREKNIRPATKISGGSVIYEAWHEGSTFAEAGNRVKVKAALTINAESATTITVVLAACSAENWNLCGERQSERAFSLSPGENRIEYADTFVTPAMPTTAAVSFLDEMMVGGFLTASFNLGGCTNPAGTCTMR